jgi:tetratricopeptide (TPR) repeat protein/transcriptional regulator with XRE-family HTH domain
MTVIQSDLQSFGALLKTFRTQRDLTQQQLAAALGMHRHAIGRWEQGDFLPASKATVLELAKQLHLYDYETRQLLEASLTTLAPPWLVPLPRNPFFTGREEILAALHAQMGVEQVVALTQSCALHGLGGIGKTQIALEYAYRYALEYSAVFWIGTETLESIFSSLLQIAEVLELPERDDREQERVVAAVQRWLTTHQQWLLIWDNIEDLTLLARFLPPSRQGSVLLTTRTQALGTLAQGINLAPLGQEEGTLLLLRRSKVVGVEATEEQVSQLAERLPEEWTAAEDLVTALGGLPLALDQAAAYIEETGCNLSSYLAYYECQRTRLLARRGQPGADHPQSVVTTFQLSMESVEREHRAAADILRVCALLHAEAIPEEVFAKGAAHLGPEMAVLLEDPSQFDQALAVLRSLSLVQRQAESRTFSLHRLVQAVLLDAMTEIEREQWSRRVLNVLDAIFPEVQAATEKDAREQSERLLPHALLCLQREEKGVDACLTFASLTYKVAQYLRERGRYDQAEPLFRRALYLHEQTLGSEHPVIAHLLNSQAALYLRQGKYEQARTLHRRALSIQERTLGPKHLDIASTLNGLAHLHFRQGQYEQAEPLYKQALTIQKQVLGSKHLDVATSLVNVAIIFSAQGKYEQAEPLFQEALHIGEEALGREHPTVAHFFTNLATFYQKQGKDEQGELLYERALYIWEQTLGPEHPNLVYPLTGLAEIRTAQKKYGQAELLYERVLHIQKQTLGPGHPDVALSLKDLANLARYQKKYTEAETLYRSALSIQEQHFGRQHPDTAEALYDLAIFYQMQHNLEEAISLIESAHSIFSQALGDAHPKTIATQLLVTQLIQAHAQEKKPSFP